MEELQFEGIEQSFSDSEVIYRLIAKEMMSGLSLR